MDKFIVVGTCGGWGPLISGKLCGVTIRNGYLYRRNLNLTHPNTIATDVEWLFVAGSTATDPVRFYNLTVLSDIPNGEMQGGYTPFSLQTGHAYEQINNVVRIVNRTAHDGDEFLPLGTSDLAGFACQHKGGKWGFPPLARRTGLITESGIDEDVVNGAWVRFPYPDLTGLSNGAGNALGVLTAAKIAANSTQFHQVSAGAGFIRMTVADGRIELDFTADWIRVRNTSGGTWSRNRLCYLLLDLNDSIMDFKAGTGQFGLAVPVPRPASSASAAWQTGTALPRSFDDFFGTRKPGSLTNTGDTVPGLASQGAFEPA